MNGCALCHKNEATVRISWVMEKKGQQSMVCCSSCMDDLWNRPASRLPNFRGHVRDTVTFGDLDHHDAAACVRENYRVI